MSSSCLWTRVMQTKGAPHMKLMRAMNSLHPQKGRDTLVLKKLESNNLFYQKGNVYLAFYTFYQPPPKVIL